MGQSTSFTKKELAKIYPQRNREFFTFLPFLVDHGIESFTRGLFDFAAPFNDFHHLPVVILSPLL